MDRGQIALHLMALYGKLRRATDDEVKAALKHQIDALVASLGVHDRPVLHARQSDRQQGVAAGDD